MRDNINTELYSEWGVVCWLLKRTLAIQVVDAEKLWASEIPLPCA